MGLAVAAGTALVAGIRADEIHRATTALTHRHEVVVL
jgi:hypothetical protein